MVNADLHQFVREALARGIPRERIRASLAQAGWRPEETEAALAAWAESDLPVPVPRRRVPPSAGEAFLYLVMFATLYVAAYNTGAALFTLIEGWLPDPAMSRIPARPLEPLRWAAAGMLIAFPVYLACARAVARGIAAEPEKAGSGVRRWLTYLTLFVAALVLVGDFIVVVWGMLSGELTTRFLLKSAVVFAIAGVMFGHFLASLRRDEGLPPPAFARSPWLGRAGGIGVALTLIVTLVVAGSPQRARVRQIDLARLRDLQNLQRRVEAFHALRGRLPLSLDEALTAMPGDPGARPDDPETGEPYGFTVVDSLSYTLCATFTAADSLGPWGGVTEPFWRHGAGPHCFTFKVRRPPIP
jgi:hypothetical protein